MGLEADSRIRLDHKYRRGERNQITDVSDVTVGQVTLEDEECGIHTGVTVIRPHDGNLFQEKLAAGAAVINGFGKSTGLVQVEELGTLETPIVLTNTLSVGTALDALTKYMLEENPDIGIVTGTVNGIVMECNDGSLNDIRGLHVTEAHVREALMDCRETFAEGAVGSGTGMCCMGLKGGIGSASRLLQTDGADYVIGALVMTNFGMAGNLRVNGKRMAETEFPPKGAGLAAGDLKAAEPSAKSRDAESAEVTLQTAEATPGSSRNTRLPLTTRLQHEPEHGSVIIVLATDLPLSDRQLKRLARRSAVALARVGSYLGNGSGDIALAFSTANRTPHYGASAIYEQKAFRDDRMDPVFEAAAEAVEEAVLSSLDHARTVQGARGKVVYALREYL